MYKTIFLRRLLMSVPIKYPTPLILPRPCRSCIPHPLISDIVPLERSVGLAEGKLGVLVERREDRIALEGEVQRLLCTLELVARLAQRLEVLSVSLSICLSRPDTPQSLYYSSICHPSNRLLDNLLDQLLDIGVHVGSVCEEVHSVVVCNPLHKPTRPTAIAAGVDDAPALDKRSSW